MTHAEATLRGRAADRFVAIGWLLPALFPIAMTIGRGMFNTTLALYVAWALIAAPRLRLHGHRTFLLLFGLLFASYLLSVPVAIDPLRALKIWGMTLAFASVAPISLAVLQHAPTKLAQLLRALGIGALLLLLGSYIDGAIVLATHDMIVPRLDLRAVDLAFSAPFLYAWLLARRQADRPDATTRAAVVVALGLLGLYVVLSDERGSLMGLVASLCGLGLLVLKFRPWRVVLLALAGFALALAVNGDALLRGLGTEADLFTRLDTFSSWRLTLWHQAISHPPATQLIGVGMGQAQYYPEVVTIPDNSVRHLHNLWLDAWYETGWLGVGMLIALIAYVPARTATVWSRLEPPQRFQAGLFVTAAVAVIVQAQFSISYASREFGVQVFLCFAALLHIVESAAVRRPAAARPTPVKASKEHA